MDVNLVDKQGKQSGFPVRSSVKTEDKCIRTAETGSHLCVSAMTGELSKAPKRWWGNFICASKMASRFVPSDVSFGDVRHHSLSSCQVSRECSKL